MIDLSFLTEEEQEAIMKVLQRDAELKKAEEDRVRVLEDSIDDTNELKNKTGQWFYEAKSKRHRDKIHGADLIRASIRKKKPQTIAELSQSISERSKKSWVSNVNKDLFVPPELFGVMEEPDREDEEEKTQGQLYRSAPKVDNLAFSESEANIQKAVSSPSKQRRNPFNTTSHDNFDLTPENHISENGSARLHEIPEKDVLPISRKSQKSKNIPTIEFSETNQTSSDALIGPDVHEEKKVPKPKARTVTYKIADPQSDSDSSFSKPAMRNDSINGTGARKGILKRSPSSSSTDSEVLRVSYSIDSQSKPVAPTSPIPEGDVEKNDFGGPSEQFSQNSVDRFKQVRFTSISAPDELPETPDSHNGKEIGEFDLLESDYGKNSVDNSNGMNYLHNEHQSSEYRIPAHPETVDFDSNIAVTVSKEEDGDSELALALQSLPSKVDQDVRANVPSAKQVPSSSVIAVQPLPSNSEFLQDGPPAVFTNLRTPKDVSANGNEVPTNDTFSNNQSMDQLNIRSQTSEFVVDQQPIYAQIKSPRKLDSSDSLQGRESIDETEPSRKTEIILKKTLQPKNDDKRDNSNISHNLQCNRNVRVSDDVTFGNSTHVNDQQPLDAEIKSPQVSKLNSTDHPQGKPTRAGDLSPKSSSKSDKYIIEFKKAADESISKVLDWFNRDSLPSEARTTPMNATEKVFVEESDPSSKTEARAIVLESPRPHADKLRLKDSHLESQPSSATDRAKPFTLNEGAQWKREQLSFENNVNVGRKSGGNGFHDGPDFENQSFKPTSFPPRIESHSPGTGGEQLLFGKSKSGGGKIHFETEYMQDGIQETNSLTTETVPEPRKKSQDHGNRTSVSFSENFFDEPKQDDNKTQRLNNVKKDTFSSPIKLNVDQEVDSNVLDKGEHQQDNLLYWRRPAILQQKAPIQARDKIQTPATKINNDIEKATEWDITANQSKPTFEGDGITNRIGSGLVKVPHETKDKKEDSLDKELQNEAEISIVKVGKSAWASKASESKTMPYKPTDITSAEPTVLSERMSGKDVHSPRDDDWQRKGVATSESSNYERVNANNSLPGKERSPDFQQKHKFQILSLKDRQRESATDKPSNPEQFQSLRNFWSTDIKSPVKAEVKPSVRSVAPVQDRQSPGFLQVEKSLGRNSQNALPAQDSSVSDFNEKDFQIKEWQRKEWVPSPIDISMPESVQTVAKVDAPSKLKDDCKSSVEKLNKEASKMERKVEIGTVNSDLEIAGMKSPETMPPLNQKTLAKNSPSSQSELGQGLFYDRVRRRSHELQDHQRLQAQSLGVIETVEKTIPPSKNDSAELKASLEKLHNEALNAPSPTRQRTEMGQAVTKSSPIPTQQTLYKEHEVKAPRQEIQEIIEKAAAPPKTDVHEFNAGLQKLLEEASVASPEATSDQGKGQQSASSSQSVFENIKYENDSLGYQNKVQYNQEEVQETFIKMAAPEKVEFSAFDSGLEKLYKEASEAAPTSPTTTENREDIHMSMSEHDRLSFRKGGELLRKSDAISSIITRPASEGSNTIERVSHSEKTIVTLPKTAPEPISLAFQERPLATEVSETVDKTDAPSKEDVGAFNVGLEKLYQESLEFSNNNNAGQIEPEDIRLANGPISSVSSEVKLLVKKEPLNESTQVKNKEGTTDTYLINESRLPETPSRNVVFLQKTVHTSFPSESSLLKSGEENVSMAKTYQVNDIDHPGKEEAEIEDLIDDHGYLPDAESGRFVRTSTPVERGTSVKSSSIKLRLSPPEQRYGDVSKSIDSVRSERNVGSNTENVKKSSCSEDDLNPVMADLRRTSSKPKPSKSLEDLSSASSKPAKVDLPREESVRSNEHEEEKGNQQEAFYETIPNSSTMPSYPDNRFSDPEKLKRLSKSVPDFLNDESDDRETDSTSGGSYQLGRHKKTPSSLTNLSGSSGMASLSSVSGSVMSIYSGDFGNVDIKGNIQFSIDYVEQLREFHIFVTECKDLAVADVKKNRSDPYVKSYLLPDKEKMGKRKTTVKKKTLNPAYNEILRYKINKPHLLTQKLNLSVWHNDTFGRNSFLGEVDIHLAAWDWNNKQMNWYPLQPRTPAAGIGLENRGEMTISLKYTSIPSSGKNAASSGEVHIWVKSCSNLPILRGNRINSFVKCTVLPDTSRKSRQKTRNVDKTINPVFNHTMVYDGFRAEDLREACVELTVWDHNRLANHFLGGLRLGLGSGKSYGTPVDWMDSTSYEASLWKRMMNSPDQWVEDTLQLRMLMMAKMAK
ncbi:synaptotagmin-like protein 2 isoform X3 [Ambystoma mexicanum]|uniref:synaptotagmin-like protein 2 isoform X3 n=1 Tax=Ambystoma mexicanum TaxID=8296 RepID=UPI0037E72119